MNMAQSDPEKPTFRFGDFELVPSDRLLTRDGEGVRISTRVLDALILLVEARGGIVSKEELFHRLWPETVVEENNLSQTISALRKVLGTQDDGRGFIETVPKVGFRLLAHVTEVSADYDASDTPANIASEPKRISTWKLALAVLILLLLVVAAIVGVSRYRTGTQTLIKATDVGPKRLTTTPENENVTGWTNDGQILFTRWANANLPETYKVSPDGGEPQKAIDLPDVRQAVWSPDGTMIVFWKYSDSGAGTYLSKADGSDPKKLPFSAENVSWAPDGSKFAFQANAFGETKLESTEVLTYELKDGKITQITANKNFDGDAGWSPDGGTIVFSSDRDGNYEIYSMKADGTDVKRLTNNAGHDSFPKFSPDGTLISFNSNFESETTDIYVMRTDGSNVIRLTSAKGHDFSRNGWSPDGTKFAYNSNVDGNDDVFVMDIDVFRPVPLISMPDADLKTPAYSPDGERIVFSAVYPDHHSELRIFDRATGKSAVIVTTSSPENYPQWSPDGNWIAFHQEVNGKWDIFKVRPDGSDLTNLTNDPSSDSIPVWSADSATIYFRSNRNGDTENAELFKMNADGTGQTPLPIQKGKLGWPSVSLKGDEILYAADRHNDPLLQFDIYAADISTGTERLIISRPKHDTHPTYSYDGSRIAFVARSDGNAEIYIANADGTSQLRLTRNPADDRFPGFSFDGKTLLFTSDRSGRVAIYELTLDQR